MSQMMCNSLMLQHGISTLNNYVLHSLCPHLQDFKIRPSAVGNSRVKNACVCVLKGHCSFCGHTGLHRALLHPVHEMDDAHLRSSCSVLFSFIVQSVSPCLSDCILSAWKAITFLMSFSVLLIAIVTVCLTNTNSSFSSSLWRLQGTTCVS